MIDLSFLTDAEQEAILKVLNRDAELKKAEDERVRVLQGRVKNDSEFKYKSGQWFYDAKSRRHKEKIHGVDLVRASIRKRKKPATIEMFGLMEAPDEAEEDVKVKKDEGNQSSNPVSVISPDKAIVNQSNGITPTPGKPRQNPFNSEDVTDHSEHSNSTSSPQNSQVNGTPKSKDEILSTLSKYGVRLPYPELTKDSQISQKANEDSQISQKANEDSQISKKANEDSHPQKANEDSHPQKANEDSQPQKANENSQPKTVLTPVPKPRTLKMNNETQQQPSPVLKKDSPNGANKPRGILKRWSSTSSTDSESLRLTQSIEPNKIGLWSGSSPESGHHDSSEETISDNSTDRFKQVRFSEKVHQRPPTPIAEPYVSKEIGEYGILEPALGGEDLNGFDDHLVIDDPEKLEEPLSEQGDTLTLDHDEPKVFEPSSDTILESNKTLEIPDISIDVQPALLQVEGNLVEPEEDAGFSIDVKPTLSDVEGNFVEPNKEESSTFNDQLITPKSSPDISLELPSNDSTGVESLYAVVNKATKTSSSSQVKDFDLDDALMEPRFHPQRGKTKTANQSERPLEFGKSNGGDGKVGFKSYSLDVAAKENDDNSSMEKITATSYSKMEHLPSNTNQNDDGFVAVPLWRRLSGPGDYEKMPSQDITRERETVQTLQNGSKVKDSSYAINLPNLKYSPGEHSGKTKFRNSLGADGSDNHSPTAQGGKAGKTFLRENKGRKDLPKSANFKVMSLNERMNAVPSEQMANPSQFQSLKHFWNVEEKNPVAGQTDVSPSKLLTDFLSRNKSPKAELQQRNSQEFSTEEVNLPNALDSLSEEEQAAQKVASWLAKTPAMEEEEHINDQGDEILGKVQKSTVAAKTEKYSTDFQKPKEAALESPRIVKAGEKSEDIQVKPLEKPHLHSKKTTLILSPASQTLEGKVPAADVKMSNNAFYDRIQQMSNKQSPVKETMTPKKQATEENVEKASAPAKTENEYKIRFKPEDDFVTAKVSQSVQMSQPSVDEEDVIVKAVAPESHEKLDFLASIKKLEMEAQLEAEEVIVKSQAPESHEKMDFISSLRKLENEASETLPQMEESEPLPQFDVVTEDVIEKSVAPESHEKIDFISSLRRLEIEASEPLPQLETEEVIEKSMAPESHEKIDFISSLRRLENEASEPLPQLEEETEEVIEKSVAPESHEKMDFISSLRRLAMEASEPLPQVETEEVIEKSVAPESHEKLDFISSLRKLEEEASEPLPQVETEEVIEKSVAPESHEKQDFISSLRKLEEEAFNTLLVEEEEVETPRTQDFMSNLKKEAETEELIEKSKAPESHDKQDFITALNKLETEASSLPLSDEAEHQDILGDDIQKYSVGSVHSSYKICFENDLPDEAQENEMPSRAQSVQYHFLKTDPLIVEHNIEEVDGLEETVEKMAAPGRKDEEFGNTLRKLEHEALEQQDLVYLDNVPKSRMTLKTDLIEDYSPAEDASIDDGKSEHDLEKSIAYQKIPDVCQHENQPVVDEGPIQRVLVEMQESSSDFHQRLMRLEEEASVIPEEPEDLLEDDTIKISPFPNREVFISKKVYSSIESFPPPDYPTENERSEEALISPRSKELKSQKLAIYQNSSGYSGYPEGTDSVIYEVPDDQSTDALKPKKGKPAQTETQSDASPSKSDKYAFEVMKAQDESISKVLDWFNRTSDVSDVTRSAGKESEEKTLPFLSPIGAIQVSRHNQTNTSGPEMLVKIGSTSGQEFPETAERPQSGLSLSSPDFVDHNMLSVEHPSVPTGSPLQYGNGGCGYGKMSNQSKSPALKEADIQEANYLDLFEDNEEGLSFEKGAQDNTKGSLTQVETMLASSPNNSEDPGKCNSENTNDQHSAMEEVEFGLNEDQPGVNGDASKVCEKPQPRNTVSIDQDIVDLLNVGHSPVHIMEDESIPSDEIHLVATDTPSNLDIWEKPEKPHSPISISNIKTNYAPPPELPILEDLIMPNKGNSELETHLEFGNTGGGSGKTSHQQISDVLEKPGYASFSSRESVNSDYTDALNVSFPLDKSLELTSQQLQLHLELPPCQTELTNDDLVPTNIVKNPPPPQEQVNSNLGNGNILELDKHGNEFVNEVPEIFGHSQAESPLYCTENFDHSEVNIAPVHIEVPAEQMTSSLVAIDLPSSSEFTKNFVTQHLPQSSVNKENVSDASNEDFTMYNVLENPSPNIELCEGLGESSSLGDSEVFMVSPNDNPIAVLDVAHSPVELVKHELVASDDRATELPPNLEIPQNSHELNFDVSAGKTKNTTNHSYLIMDESLTPSNIVEKIPDSMNLNIVDNSIPKSVQQESGSIDGLNDVRSVNALNDGVSKVLGKYQTKSEETRNVENVDLVNNLSPLSVEDTLVNVDQMDSVENLVLTTEISAENMDLHDSDKENNPFIGQKQEQSPLNEQSLKKVQMPDNYYAEEKENSAVLRTQNVNSKSPKLIKSNAAQKKVGDMKLLWESEGSSQPTVKIIPMRSQRSFSPIETFLERPAMSVDSDDRSSPSLVSFKKVLVDDEEGSSPPVDQLKYFWEHGINKESKPVEKSSAAVADLTSKIKRLTLHSYFEKDHHTGPEKKNARRSVSVSDAVGEGMKKSATFQSLRSFWNVDSKSRSMSSKSDDAAFLESKKRQFRSNPDLSEDSVVAKIKSKLDSKSLMDVREDVTSSHFQSRAPNLRKSSKDRSGDRSSRSIEALYVAKYPSQKSLSEHEEESPSQVKVVSETLIKSSAPSAMLNESPTLQFQRNDQHSSKDTSDTKKDDPEKKSPIAYKYGPKPFLVKQAGFDTKSPMDSSMSVFFNNGRNGEVSRRAQTETFEKPVVPAKKDHEDIDQGLKKLDNGFLGEARLNQNENLYKQKPEESYNKVMTVSSGKVGECVQRGLSNDSPTYRPIVIDFASKKMIGKENTPPSKVREDLGTLQNVPTSRDVPEDKAFQIERPTSKPTTVILTSPLKVAGVNEGKNIQGGEQTKEVVERIAIPTIHPRALFNKFDEGINKLYYESRDLKSAFSTTSITNSKTLQITPIERPPKESETFSSEVADKLKPEITEIVGRTNAPTKMSFAESFEKLQKEAMNDDKEPLMEHLPPDHWAVAVGVPEIPTRVEETPVQNQVETPPYNALTFTDARQSTPVKDSGSLRRSTLELFLAAPYRKEISKSMDFELGGYIASDTMEDGYQLNSSNPPEKIPENAFPTNADKYKQMSQSVPAFLQDETDGRDTDSASENSFQLGRHKKTPSSLTNLSGSSGMASMSSVSGSNMSVYSGDFGNVDVRGSIEFSLDYVEQLKEFMIYIYQCKDLAAADVKRQRSDPYVKAYLLPEKAKMGKRKTAVKKKTLSPVYNEILRYKMPKDALLAQTLNLSVWHHDALGRNSFLGEVNVILASWNWSNTPRDWYQLEPRTPAAGIGLVNRGEMKLALKYIPWSPETAKGTSRKESGYSSISSTAGSKAALTGEVHIWIKECLQLPMLRENKINSFVKCTVLPDTSRKSRQKTRNVDKTTSPIFNHTMVYDGFKEEDLREACVELTVWDHNRLSNHFIGGLRVGLGTGKSYGTAVDWMDSTHEESTMWQKMMSSPNTWIEGLLPLRALKMAKITK